MAPFDTAAETMAENIDRLAMFTLKKRPAMASVVKPFAALFRVIAFLVDRLRPELDVDDLSFDVDGLSSGDPLMFQVSLSRWHKPLSMAFKSLTAASMESFPSMALEFARLKETHDRGALDLDRLAEDYLHMDFENIERAAQEGELLPESLAFMVHFSLSAVLQALAPHPALRLKPDARPHGYCPICGFQPSISYLAKPLKDPSQFLQGGGGQKYLHCALCGHDWRFSRNACPACGNEDKDQRFYVQVQGESSERVDICRKCGMYLPCLDSRLLYDTPHLDMASVSLLHLEILARKEGFHPMTRTPWNRFE